MKFSSFLLERPYTFKMVRNRNFLQKLSASSVQKIAISFARLPTSGAFTSTYLLQKRNWHSFVKVSVFLLNNFFIVLQKHSNYQTVIFLFLSIMPEN